LAATTVAIIGAVAAGPAVAQEWYGGAYHHGYTDHQWGGGYYDGYVGSYGSYNDSPTWSRGYAQYYPAYAPGDYTYGGPYYGDSYYSYGYAPAPGIGVRVGPVGIGIFP
jgi:hypothetical protein